VTARRRRIDGGSHADEALGAQQLIELGYQLASATDEETLRLLRDVIVLVVHANPDGHELVANWYMRERDPQRRSLDGIPRLYQKYAGHDNNEISSSPAAETTNMNRVSTANGFPRSSSTTIRRRRPTVMFAPPFRDPFNYVFDPLIPVGIDPSAPRSTRRFAAEGKPGVTMRGSTH
jgi:hypothetical protein